MKKSTHSDFIGVYDGYFSDGLCDSLLTYFEHAAKTNRIWDRGEDASKLRKKDVSTSAAPVSVQEIVFNQFPLRGVIEEFNSVFWEQCFAEYAAEYESVNTLQKFTIRDYKLQKTRPGGGYHIWHCENDCIDHSRRIGAYTLYLNNVELGGETEFLYQKTRLPSQKGRLCIFPAGYTHPHRGNPPLDGDKYIMTGWIEYI